MEQACIKKYESHLNHLPDVWIIRGVVDIRKKLLEEWENFGTPHKRQKTRHSRNENTHEGLSIRLKVSFQLNETLSFTADCN